MATENHCIPIVKAICFASISEAVPTVNLQCSGAADCKFTMRGTGSTVNLQSYIVNIQCTQSLSFFVKRIAVDV